MFAQKNILVLLAKHDSGELHCPIHMIFSWTQIGRFGFSDREIGSQIGRFFHGKIYLILVSKLLFAAP